MDYKLNRESLTASEVIFDGAEEQPVDLDFNLPDYCPDIQRILKCQVYPWIMSQNLMGDRLETEGSYTVRVLYLDAQGSAIRCCENTRPFSSSIALKRPADNALAFVKTRVEYVNCRAVSSRRLDIHGAFSVCAKVEEQVKNEVTCSIEGEDIQQRKTVLPSSQIVGSSQQQFSVTEVLEISGGKPPAESILRSGAIAVVKDFKVVANKIIVRGEVELKLLYSPGADAPEPESMEYGIPFSQMLDCGGAEEDCLCRVSVDIMNFDVAIKNDSSGENTLFEADVRLVGNVFVYRNTEVTAVTDAYSTERELSIAYRPGTVELLVDVLHDNYIQKSTLDLGEAGISKILDVWNEMNTVSVSEEEHQIVCKGKMNLCVLAVGADGRPFYVERMADFQYNHDWEKRPEGVTCDVSARIPSIGYRITGTSSLETKAEIDLSVSVFLRSNCQIIAEVTGDEDHPKQKDSSAALTLYYADAGESLWDIARTYCTSVQAILEENGMAEEAPLDGGMLLIPMEKRI